MAELQPLRGRRVLVTLSATGAGDRPGDLEVRLIQLGAEVLALKARDLVPPESFAPLEAALDRLNEFGWLVFTSQNAIEPFFARLSARGMGLSDLRHLRLAAIGTRTADSLKQRGRAPDLVPARHVAEALADLLAPEVAGTRVLLPRALAAREVLPERLLAAGALEVCAVPAYRAVPTASDPEPVLRALAAGEVDAVTFASAGTVRAVLALLGDPALPALRRCRVVCIGPVTGEACREAGMMPLLADPATNQGLVDALVRALTRKAGKV